MTGKPGLCPTFLRIFFDMLYLQTNAFPLTEGSSRKIQELGKRNARMGPLNVGFGVSSSTDSHEKGSVLRKNRRNGPQTAVEKLLDRVNRHLLAVTAGLEGNDSIYLGEERIVPAQPHIASGVELGATLPNNDAASLDRLSTISLHAKKLRVAVPTVSAGAYTFFMCHRYPQ